VSQGAFPFSTDGGRDGFETSTDTAYAMPELGAVAALSGSASESMLLYAPIRPVGLVRRDTSVVIRQHDYQFEG
jgi:hypothetical protein